MSREFTTADIAIVAGFELAALVVIVRLWVRRGLDSVFVKLLWSVVLLVPVLGLAVYLFLRTNPDEHGESPPPDSIPG